MELITGVAQEKLEGIKDKIKDFHDYFVDNYLYFNMMRKFIFVSSLNQTDRDVYADLGVPVLEFPILESKISRLLGEFSSQEPFVEVRKQANSQVSPELLHLIEGYFRNIFTESNRDNMEYEIYRDCLSGGFSAFKVYTDYPHPMSGHQDIMMRRCFDPTMTLFDKKAVASHKGDGNYCGEMFMMSKKEFEDQFGNKATKNMKFRKEQSSLFGYNWSYGTGKNGEEMVMIGDFYEKKPKMQKIVTLSNGMTMLEEKYSKYSRDFFKQNFMKAPKVLGKPRMTETFTIERSWVCESEVLESEMTDYEDLPIIFVDGNSILNKDEGGAVRQVVRSYVHQAKDAQKMKNLAGMMLANEIENTMQHKLMITEEAIPSSDAARMALTNYQKSKLITTKGFKDGTDIPLPMPMAVPRLSAPPEMIQAFSMMDNVTQSILGNYDAALGINDNELSGQAVEQSAMHSNMASRPYKVNYMRAFNQGAKIMLNLIPKYHTFPRSLPVKDVSGNFDQVQINGEGQPQIKDLDPHQLQIVVKSGVDFEVQRQKAFAMLRGLSAESPAIGEFLGTTPQGISMVLDNVDMRGIDALKAAIPQFVQQLNMQKQQKMQMEMQDRQIALQSAQAPIMIKQQELQLTKAKLDLENQIAQIKLQLDHQIEVAKLGIDQQNADTKQFEAVSKSGESADKTLMDAQKIDAQNARTMVDAMQAEAGTRHGHAMDMLNLDHTKTMSQLTHELEKVKVALQHNREVEKIRISDKPKEYENNA